MESGGTASVFSTSYDVSGLPGSSYDLYRNELDGHSNASAILINLPMMASDQAQSLAGNSAFAGYALLYGDRKRRWFGHRRRSNYG